MIKVSEVVKHFESLYKNKAIYLWGANCEVITQELCNKLYRNFKSSKYDLNYYQNKFNEGKGKIGADCSGAFYTISGFDTTAQGYYSKCSVKGVISAIPKDKPCLVFKGTSTSKITHIGMYMGDGNVIEMKSSKENCVKDVLDGKGWKWFGIPDWIDYSSMENKNKTFSPYLTKTTSDLNLRSSATSASVTNIITIIPKDSFVYVVKHISGVWVQVNVIVKNKSYSGYVSKNYLSKVDISKNEQRKVTASGLNARTGKGTLYPKAFTMSKGDEFIVITLEKWGLILYKNKLGYANISDAYSQKI